MVRQLPPPTFAEQPAAYIFYNLLRFWKSEALPASMAKFLIGFTLFCIYYYLREKKYQEKREEYEREEREKRRKKKP